uniref:NADH-ubiquinone oxidoreductase chain 6 n=1 Tax=Ocnus glacialis TaxID=3074281 RepID=A0AA51UG14_9ECHN|nr:NADH dehydrogenase subunit 6 [Ocnus glacialis]WMW14028.1 NADH dehydrogenase subunit 6 [Ocnus glacialis]
MLFYLISFFLLIGGTMVYYSISPYFASLGLILLSIFGCLLLGYSGVSFMAIILLLIYTGGMLVVFVFSSALSADRFPTISSLSEFVFLFFITFFWFFFVFDDVIDIQFNLNSSGILSLEDIKSLGELYYFGGIYLILGGLALLVVLTVVLILSFSFSVGPLRSL